jgi:uncharacterized membrane protein (DUF4010 family)
VTNHLVALFPAEGAKIVLTLFLSFLIGLEREERRAAHQRTGGYSFGGVRAFPLIGLLGYALALLSGPQLAPIVVGFAVIGAFLWLSYRHKLEADPQTGITTELSGLATYVIGALVSREQFWIATTLAILAMLLLELKDFLENLATRIPGEEIFTFTKFLLLTAVILPIVPDRNFTRFALNPFKTWLIVVAISGLSYGSYLLEKLAKGKGGVQLAALLGGAYSSTFATFVIAKQGREAKQGAARAYSGAILLASGVMYFRFLVEVGLFNAALMHRLLLPFTVLGVVGMLGGWAWSLIPDQQADGVRGVPVAKNPLELSAAFVLAAVLVIIMVLINVALARLGHGGIYTVAVLAGLAPVDPFIMGLTQTAGTTTPFGLAAGAVVVAAASNNFAKAIIARVYGERATGGQGLALLLALTVLGLVPLIWVVR